jgi:hypothetical protein
MTTPWSNGPIEGQINRLKAIKRQMYGRAGFELLKARVLALGCFKSSLTLHRKCGRSDLSAARQQVQLYNAARNVIIQLAILVKQQDFPLDISWSHEKHPPVS